MLTLESYCNNLRIHGNTLGQARRSISNDVIENTWQEDTQAHTCYIYDFYHDDEPESNYELTPENSMTKIGVKAKFIVSSYNSDGKDQVSYHLQFRKSDGCHVPYFNEDYGKKYGVMYPVGLYIDIPDANGIYRRWLISEDANTYDPQFVTWSILPCDFRFAWICNGKKHRMWGVQRSQNSYNSGVWRDYRIETIENQKKFILPLNKESMTLFYNQRMILSAPVDEGFEPICWRITKIENTDPLGIQRVTLGQDIFNQHTDYIERDKDGIVVAMWADYFESKVEPMEQLKPGEEVIVNTHSAKILFEGVSPKIKIGGSSRRYTLQCFTDGESVEAFENEWSFAIDGSELDAETMDEIIEIVDHTSDSVELRFIGDEDEYLGSILTVINKSEYTSYKLDVEITGV